MALTLTPSSPAAGASAAAVARGVAAIAARRRAEVEVLEAALEFALAHRVTAASRAASWDDRDEPTTPVVLFGAQPLALAGRGAPRVSEFAPMEWAAALDVSHEAALSMLGDVLDLSTRLPRLWGLARDLRVPAHLARLAAQESRDLDQSAAAHADRLLTWQPDRLNPHRIATLVHEARLYADPDRAAADHDAALEFREVNVDHHRGAPGTSWVGMVLDTADAEAFDHTVGTMATTMAALGSPADLGARRARAVGILADPQSALDLLAGDPNRSEDPDRDPAVVTAEDVAHSPGNPFTGTPTGREATIVFHVTDRDLLESGPLGHGGVARSRRLGPVTLDRLGGWLIGAANVTVRPVLDPSALGAIDAHDPTPRTVEAVQLRDKTCVFPRCGVPAERCDLDHIEPYLAPDDGGPSGQTHVAALACLCRKHHRAKTFGGFDYRRRADGSYEWTLPTGQTVVTDPPAPCPHPD